MAQGRNADIAEQQCVHACLAQQMVQQPGGGALTLGAGHDDRLGAPVLIEPEVGRRGEFDALALCGYHFGAIEAHAGALDDQVEVAGLHGSGERVAVDEGDSFASRPVDPGDVGLGQRTIAQDCQLHVGKMLADVFEYGLSLDAEAQIATLPAPRSVSKEGLVMADLRNAGRALPAGLKDQRADAYACTIRSYLAGRIAAARCEQTVPGLPGVWDFPTQPRRQRGDNGSVPPNGIVGEVQERRAALVDSSNALPGLVARKSDQLGVAWKLQRRVEEIGPENAQQARAIQRRCQDEKTNLHLGQSRHHRLAGCS